jgi:hypothetical protein
MKYRELKTGSAVDPGCVLDSKPEGLGEDVIGCRFVAMVAVSRLRPTGFGVCEKTCGSRGR